MYRTRFKGVLAELGLAHPVGRSLLLAFLATLPGLLLVALTTRSIAETHASVLIRTGIASAVSEEILYRGFLFRQLYRRARWPFILAGLANAFPFAAGHLYQAEGRGLAGFVEVMLVMGVVSLFIAFLFIAWNNNTWFVIGIHGFANLWWALFVGEETSKLYGWLQYAFLVALLIPLVLLTLWQRRQRAQ